MSFILLKTKLRNKLLAYLFTNPESKCYVRELAALIGQDVGNLSRELNSLEKEGLLESQKKGSIKYYSLNKNYPLFGEIKSIIFKTEGVEGSLRAVIKDCEGISRAFIYGSFARGKERNVSDIDLLIVGEFVQDKLIEKIKGLESKLNREINYTSFTEREYLRERKKKGSFLNTVLKSKLIALRGKP